MRLNVSLILPVKNEAGSVARTMDSVFAQTRRPDEIVIGDGHSTDGTVELILDYRRHGVPITIRRESQGRVAAGRNVAIEAARHEVIAAADFGNVLDPRWLEEIVKPLETDPTVDMVAGVARQAPPATHLERCVAAIAQPHGHGKALSRRMPDTIISGGASMAFRRSIWHAAGGFPEWIKAAEDKLFFRKVHLVGGKVVGTFDAVVYKHVRTDLKTFFRQHYHYARGNAQSRQISRNTMRLLAAYAVGLVLIVLALFVPLVWILLAVAVARHLYRSGFRPYLSAHRPDLAGLALMPVVLAARNLASILGHGAGYRDWLLDPLYQARYTTYMTAQGRRLTAARVEGDRW